MILQTKEDRSAKLKTSATLPSDIFLFLSLSPVQWAELLEWLQRNVPLIGFALLLTNAPNSVPGVRIELKVASVLNPATTGTGISRRGRRGGRRRGPLGSSLGGSGAGWRMGGHRLLGKGD